MATPPLFHIYFHFNKSLLSKISMQMADAFGMHFVGSDPIAAVEDWVAHYLEGRHLPFPLPLSLEELGPFQQRVLEELKQVEVGKTVSYQELGQRLGKPKAARAVGTACGKNPYPLVIPCHRVIATDGSLGGFAYGLEMKELLLSFERALPPKPSHRDSSAPLLAPGNLPK